MAKKVDPLKAKEAKQKKIAIGLSVLLVAVLAFQGPKTLKMLKGPTPPAPTETVAVGAPLTTTTAAGAVPPGTPSAPATAAGAPATSGDAQPAVLVDSDVPVAAGTGQLLSFERFAPVDPFEQQVDPNAVPVATTDTGGKSGAPAEEADKDTVTPDKDGTSGSVVPGTGAGTAAGGDGGSTAGGSEPEPVRSPAQTTTLSLNGAVVEVAPAAEFPADDPVFVFVSAAADGKSIEIGIAGGVYADGDETITLKVGTPLTLQNTADGSRYELELLTVRGFVPPEPKQ